MIIQPIGKRIYFTPKKDSLPMLVQDAYSEMGDVVAVGPDCKSVKPGDVIFVKGWGVDKVEHGANTYFFTQENDEYLLCIAND